MIGPAFGARLVEAMALLLLLLPLVRLTQFSRGPDWSSCHEINVLPFPDSKWALRSPLWVWHILFWAVALCALTNASARGQTAHLALISAAVEGGYGLLHLRRRMSPLDPSFPQWILAFGLWHNALTEECIFRGLPYLVIALLSFSNQAVWRGAYVCTTALTFGFYHYCVGCRSRVYDTTVFGAVLGAVTLRYGFAAAILLHSIHNARSLPLGHSEPSLRRWRRNRWLHVAGLTSVGLLSLACHDS